MARLPALVRPAAPRPRVTFVTPEPVERACAARPRRTGQRNRPATARRRRPDRRFSVVQETREPRRSLDDVALPYELGNLVPVHWASWQVEVVRHPAMTGDVLRQAEPLGISGDELLVFSRCRSDAEADAPVAVLVDDEPREVLLADEEASVRRVPIVRSCFWKGQADVRRSIEQLWFHRHIIDEAAARRAPLPLPPRGDGGGCCRSLPTQELTEEAGPAPRVVDVWEQAE